MKEQKINKILKVSLFILGVIIIVLVVEGWYFLKLKNKKITDFLPFPKDKTQLTTSEPSVPSESEEETKLSNLEIAEEVLDWMDKQLYSDGPYSYYYFGYRCDRSGNCEEPVTDGRSGLGVLWANFNYYKLNKNQESLEKINRLLSLYANEEEVDNIPVDFWTSKWLFKMHDNSSLTSISEEKFEEVFLNSYYYPEVRFKNNLPYLFFVEGYYPSFVEKSELLLDEGKLNEKRLIETIKNKRNPSQTIKERVTEEKEKQFRYSSFFASDFASRYLWKSKDDDLKKSKTYFQFALDIYNRTENTKYLEGKCVFGISALDLYRATNKKKYLAFAESLFENEKIEDVCLLKNGYSYGYCANFLREKATCGLFASELYDLTQDEEYNQIKKDFIGSLLRVNFDHPDYGYRSGQGAFYDIHKNNQEYSYFYPIRENGLIIGLILDK